MNPNSGVSTPVNQMSPPTPDTTPPRDQAKGLALQPPMGLRNLSSRTDSFKTAREDQLSSDDEGTPSQPPLLSGGNDSFEDLTPLAHPRQLDLPLTLPTDVDLAMLDDDRTPTAEMTKHEFLSFDGGWNKGGHGGTEEWVEDGPHDGLSNLTVRKEENQKSSPTILVDRPEEVPDSDLPCSRDLRRNTTLRERIERNRANEDRSSTKKFGEDILWPSGTNGFMADDSSPAVEYRRFSGISTTSTIIEALVLEMPSQNRRTLRRTGKNIALRKGAMSTSRVGSAPETVSASRHRLVHKRSNIDMKRASMAFESSVNPDNGGPSQQEALETIPVIRLPEERSSFAVHQISTSIDRPQPPPASPPSPGDNLGYFDLPRRRLKKHLVHASPAVGVKETDAGELSPTVRSQSSSLLAADGNHGPSMTSRTTDKRPETFLEQATPDLKADCNANELSPGETDHSAARRLFSAPFTPHSQLSNNSSPEALEVSEATAVSIYPHNNNSLLVVQQRSRPVSGEYEQVLPRTIPSILPLENRMDSPLSNPRNPPKPPALQVIPPTPDIIGQVGVQDEVLEEQSGKIKPTQTARSGKALALVKRALGNRRYSDGFVSPFGRTKGVEEYTQSSPQRRRPALGGRKDSKLSPFWRPRGFWDDLDLDDEDVKDEFLERGRVELFDQPRGVALSPHGLVPGTNVKQDGRSSRLARRQSPSDSLGSRPGQRRMHSLTGFGMQLEFVGWKGVQQRLRGMKVTRMEKTKEREREKIKERISTPTAINPSTFHD